jgi:hypothetical protein
MITNNTENTGGYISYASIVKAALIGLLFFIGSDCLIFRTGFFLRFITFESSYAGMVNYGLYAAERVPAAVDNLIAVVGDSRVGEGFSPKGFHEVYSQEDTAAISLGIPGSTPRVWRYLLKKIDPQRNRFRIIAIQLLSYDDLYKFGYNKNYALDHQFIAPLLGYEDIFSYVTSFEGYQNRLSAFWPAAFKWRAYREHIKSSLYFIERFVNYTKHMDNILKQIYKSTGKTTSMKGLLVKDGVVISAPAHMDKPQLDLLNTYIELSKQTQKYQKEQLANYEYEKVWITKIIEDYQDSQTKIVFFRIPDSPIFFPPSPNDKRTLLKQWSSYKHVWILPENLFTPLEKPEFFAEMVHVNNRGRALFTAMLSHVLIDILKNNKIKNNYCVFAPIREPSTWLREHWIGKIASLDYLCASDGVLSFDANISPVLWNTLGWQEQKISIRQDAPFREQAYIMTKDENKRIDFPISKGANTLTVTAEKTFKPICIDYGKDTDDFGVIVSNIAIRPTEP